MVWGIPTCSGLAGGTFVDALCSIRSIDDDDDDILKTASNMCNKTTASRYSFIYKIIL